LWFKIVVNFLSIKRGARLFPLVLIFGLGLLPACGYHLRGSVDIPESLKNVYLSGAASSLQSEMVSLLKASNAQIAPSIDKAGIVIKVMREEMKNRVVSLGTTGKSTESEVNYYLRFQFFDNKDKPIMDEQTLEISREFFNDQTAVLARSSEELVIRNELYKQAARMLMARARIAVETPKKIDAGQN
jgi:LPS-assembly lipoprotein